MEVCKPLEEIRLLESRRSARIQLQDGDQDFARLADADRRKSPVQNMINNDQKRDVEKKRPPHEHSRKCESGKKHYIIPSGRWKQLTGAVSPTNSRSEDSPTPPPLPEFTNNVRTSALSSSESIQVPG